MKRPFRWGILVAGLIIFALVVFGAMEYTSQPAFCDTCHEMGPLYRGWQTSSHRTVKCIRCHADPGIIGLVKIKFKGLRDVYYHFTGNINKTITTDTSSKAFTNRCKECHKDIVGKNPPHNKKHFKQGMYCSKCHRKIVHYEGTNRTLPTTEVCRQCHD